MPNKPGRLYETFENFLEKKNRKRKTDDEEEENSLDVQQTLNLKFCLPNF